jgi:hypothetical protein
LFENREVFVLVPPKESVMGRLSEAIRDEKPWDAVQIALKHDLQEMAAQKLLKKGFPQHAALLLHDKALNIYTQQLAKVMNYENNIMLLKIIPGSEVVEEPQKLRVMRKTTLKELKRAVQLFKKAHEHFKAAGQWKDAERANHNRETVDDLIKSVRMAHESLSG